MKTSHAPAKHLQPTTALSPTATAAGPTSLNASLPTGTALPSRTASPRLSPTPSSLSLTPLHTALLSPPALTPPRPPTRPMSPAACSRLALPRSRLLSLACPSSATSSRQLALALHSTSAKHRPPPVVFKSIFDFSRAKGAADTCHRLVVIFISKRKPHDLPLLALTPACRFVSVDVWSPLMSPRVENTLESEHLGAHLLAAATVYVAELSMIEVDSTFLFAQWKPTSIATVWHWCAVHGTLPLLQL